MVCFSLAAGNTPSNGDANLALQKPPQPSSLSRSCIENLSTGKA